MESIFSEPKDTGRDDNRDFESLYNTKTFRILQIMIPFFPANMQPLLAVGLRFSQFQYALSLYKKMSFRQSFFSDRSSAPPDTDLVFARLKSCLSPSECREVERMQNLFSMMRRFQDLEPFLSQLGGLSEDMSMSDVMDMVANFQGMASVFGSEEKDAQAGAQNEEERKDEAYEQRLDER